MVALMDRKKVALMVGSVEIYLPPCDIHFNDLVYHPCIKVFTVEIREPPVDPYSK